MSIHTNLDADVMFLDSSERINYEFDLLNHDVNKYVEASYGFAAIKDPKDIKSKFTDWRKAGLAIITVLVFILTIVLIITLIIYIVLYIRKVDWKMKILQNVSLSAGLFFVILCIMYFIFNKLLGEMIALINLVKDPPPPKPKKKNK